MKGISPLIAAVILVSIAVSLGIILASWSYKFAAKQAYESEKSFSVECTNYRINVDYAKYNSTLKVLTLKIRASGAYPVKIKKIVVETLSLTKQEFENGKDFFF